MRDAVEAQAGRFQQQTGAWVAITSVSFSSLPTMLNTVVLTDTFRYDVVVLPGGWVRDVAATGYVANLSQLVQHDALTPSNEQPSVFRGITMGDNGHLYAISLRTSLPLLRYRDDLLAQYRIPPPTTWEDYIAVTRTFNGRDLNRDGEPDYGSCLALSPEILPYHLVWAIAGGYLQTHGHQQGVFFDHETMQPTAATAGFRAAFDVFKAIMRYAPPQQQQFTRADARRLFGEGRCALTIEWDGVQPTGGAYDGVITPLPGSDMVFDPQRGSIQPCSQDNQGRYTRCPHAINGVNYALYGGYGGWAGSIHAHAPPSTQEVGLAFLLSLRNAMNEGQAQEASDALLNGDNEVARRVLTTPNWIHPLTIAHHWYYQQTMQRVLRETLLSPVEEGSEDMGDSTGGSIEAAQRISAVWEQITEMAGREAQREQYRTMLAEAP
jgi:multiple sugar transport system substrate-binding protein